jgi:hypothetical protein
MFVRKMLVVVCAAALNVSGQQTTPPEAKTTAAVEEVQGGTPKYVHPETPQQRKDRLGIPEDPGTNPDPNKHYWRYGHSQHIERFERKWAAYDQPEGYVRPVAQANVTFEIYQQNGTYVWCWVTDFEKPSAEVAEQKQIMQTNRYPQAILNFLTQERPQYSVLTPQPSGKTIHFRESSSGLPNRGSWRNSLAIADMNEDGCPDIVAPPERKGNGLPVIFLGDCKGGWRLWKEAKFPRTLDYGSVAVADFNKDGHQDLVFAVHLSGLFVFLGDGKGNFTEVSDGLPRDFPTRRVAVADIDGDGYRDIVAPSEGPTQGQNPNYGSLLGFLNRNKGKSWKQVIIADVSMKIGGDWISVGMFNRDRYPDMVVASVYFGSMNVVQMSTGPIRWQSLASNGDLLPSLSYYFASTSGKFAHSKLDDAVLSYVRYWPTDLDPKLVATPDQPEATNVDLLTFDSSGAKRIPIVRWAGHGGVWGMAQGDFDGDGNLDIFLVRDEPREAVILLGDGHGKFRTAKFDGLTLDPNRIYDVKVADLNRDGRPDVILMYETSTTTVFTEKDGSIHVFLNQGASDVVAPAPAK